MLSAFEVSDGFPKDVQDPLDRCPNHFGDKDERPQDQFQRCFHFCPLFPSFSTKRLAASTNRFSFLSIPYEDEQAA